MIMGCDEDDIELPADLNFFNKEEVDTRLSLKEKQKSQIQDIENDIANYIADEDLLPNVFGGNSDEIDAGAKKIRHK